ISAYRLSGTGQIVAAMQELVNRLSANLESVAGIIDHAAKVCQKYSYPEIKDLSDFLDTLSNSTNDPQLSEKAIAVKNMVSGSLRLRNYKGNGEKPDFSGAIDVSRSQGLSI